jgi:crotonobetainyl-CoA:carnitine CoA-transferase CaiB-like acyl-CoA transferase
VSAAQDRSGSRSLPLAGLTVLDFGHTVMGPTCGLVLADLGADVIRIEPPAGERTRSFIGFASGFFGYFNRNKRSVAVDLKKPEGLAVVRDLIKSADVLIENFAPGTMARLGLGWDDARALNERLIYCSLKGYLSGPYEELLALDEVVQMQAGLAYMTGPPGMPLRAGTSIVDITGALFGVIGILAALNERRDTGKGKLVQSALFESTAFLVGQHMAAVAITGVPSEPMPVRRGGGGTGGNAGAWTVYDTFATRDGAVFVGVTSEPQWQRFCEVFKLKHLETMPEFATRDARLRNRKPLLPHIQEVLGTLTLAEVLERARSAQLPCAPVGRPDDLFDDPHLKAGGGLVEVELRDDIRAPVPALPVAFGDERFGVRRQPPGCGADTVDVLAEHGYTAGRIADLIAAGIIGGRQGTRSR